MKKKSVPLKNKIFYTLARVNDYLSTSIIFVILFFLYGAYVLKTYKDFKTIQNADCRIVEVRKITKQEKGWYEVEISYKENGETLHETFSVKKSFADSVSGAFDSRYRKGNKIPVLVGEGGNIIPYSERKNTIMRNLILELCVFIPLALISFSIIRAWTFKSKYEEKTPYGDKELWCEIFKLFMILSFISGWVLAFYVKEESATIGFCFFTLGIFLYLPQIILKKQIQIRAKVVKYEENPVLFCFLFAVYLYVFGLMIHVCFLQT